MLILTEFLEKLLIHCLYGPLSTLASLLHNPILPYDLPFASSLSFSALENHSLNHPSSELSLSLPNFRQSFGLRSKLFSTIFVSSILITCTKPCDLLLISATRQGDLCNFLSSCSLQFSILLPQLLVHNSS
jgi:hypothetical protein